MKIHRYSFMLVCAVLCLFLIGSAADAASIIRLEKDVPRSALTGAPDNVTFELFDSNTAPTPVATQTFPRGQWWADYDFTKFGAAPQSMVRFKADFSNTDGLTIDMELWVEIKLDGVLKGPRERVKKECWALFSEQALGATTAQTADWAADADMLDGKDSAEFSAAVHPHNGADITSGTVGEGYIDAAIARDSEIMPAVLDNDGPGSSLDADNLDGLDSTAFSSAAHTHSGSDITTGTVADSRIAGTIARDNEIMPEVLGNDGSGSSLDADTVDGVHASGFVTQADYDALLARVEALEAKLAYMSVQTGEINGLAGPHVVFSDANVHIRSGSGSTNDGGVPTGLGNLIVGYNEDPSDLGVGERAGSHNLIIGPYHRYERYGGLVAGYRNALGASYASVSGGYGNTADGNYSSVSGGQYNQTTASYSSVSGGQSNTASGLRSSVTGGKGNEASVDYATVSGGSENSASGNYSSVAGGWSNVASASYACVSGGNGNTASGYCSSVSGGSNNESAGSRTSVSGGSDNSAHNIETFIGGGSYNKTYGDFSSILGGRENETHNTYATVGGGYLNEANGWYSSVSGGSSRVVSGSYDWAGGSCYFCTD